jgi:hypothetical protein
MNKYQEELDIARNEVHSAAYSVHLARSAAWEVLNSATYTVDSVAAFSAAWSAYSVVAVSAAYSAYSVVAESDELNWQIDRVLEVLK